MEKMIVEKITEITEAIKGVAPEVWRIMIKQSYVVCISNIIWGLFSLGLVISCIKFWKYINKKRKINNWDTSDPEYILPIFLIGTLSIVGVMVFICCTDEAIKYVINPEYYAIQGLIPK